MTDELKPDNCLLCGGECYFQMLPDANANPIPAIICKKCKIRVYFYDESLDTRGVIAAWNTRHNESDEMPEWAIDAINERIDRTRCVLSGGRYADTHEAEQYGQILAYETVLSLRKPEDEV